MTYKWPLKGLNFINNDCETLNSVIKSDDKLITIALKKVFLQIMIVRHSTV